MPPKRLEAFLITLTLAVMSCITVPETKTLTPPVAIPPDQTEIPIDPAKAVILQEFPVQVGYGVRGSWFELFFTDPSENNNTGGPDDYLSAAIDQARQSVDVAAYSMNLWKIRNSLIDAHHRGVTVRIVIESDNLSDDVPQALSDAGVAVLGDRREGLMHNKFVVIDRSEVWMGSMNFTLSSMYRDNNNMIRVRSVKVAEDYTKEFDEMFMQDLFGLDILAETPNPRVVIDGTSLEIYFSPDDGVGGKVLEKIQHAKESIYFMAYSFTSDDIADAIIEREKAGVLVAGVMDADQMKSNNGTEYDRFRQNGLDVRLDGNPGLMHHKVMIIDQKIVITGSYNFTASAEYKNDENVIIIINPDIAAQYLVEFQRVYTRTQP